MTMVMTMMIEKVIMIVMMIYYHLDRIIMCFISLALLRLLYYKCMCIFVYLAAISSMLSLIQFRNKMIK